MAGALGFKVGTGQLSLDYGSKSLDDNLKRANSILETHAQIPIFDTLLQVFRAGRVLDEANTNETLMHADHILSLTRSYIPVQELRD